MGHSGLWAMAEVPGPVHTVEGDGSGRGHHAADTPREGASGPVASASGARTDRCSGGGGDHGRRMEVLRSARRGLPGRREPVPTTVLSRSHPLAASRHDGAEPVLRLGGRRPAEPSSVYGPRSPTLDVRCRDTGRGRRRPHIDQRPAGARGGTGDGPSSPQVEARVSAAVRAQQAGPRAAGAAPVAGSSAGMRRRRSAPR